MTGKNHKDAKKLELMQKQKELDKKLKEQAANEMKALFLTAVAKPQAVPEGVSAKSILCEFHKKGLCSKKNCKFSHDLDPANSDILYKAGAFSGDVKARNAIYYPREAPHDCSKFFMTVSCVKLDVNCYVVACALEGKMVEFLRSVNKCTNHLLDYGQGDEQGRKQAKIDLYTDQRTAENDTMDETWNMDKLQNAIDKANQRRVGPAPTDIVCKFFLNAVETNVYGWFWKCPAEADGSYCHYQHKLPPGFVLKSKEEVDPFAESAQQVDIGLELEEKRSKLDLSKCTTLTLELFNEWKVKQAEKKKLEVLEKAKVAPKTGKGIMSGRDMFIMNESLFDDLDEENVASDYENDSDDDEKEHDDNRQDTEINYNEQQSIDGEATATAISDQSKTKNNKPKPAVENSNPELYSDADG